MKMIPLGKGKFATIDDEDYERINKHTWHLTNQKKDYAARWEKKKAIFMHREILGISHGTVTDHIDGNGLNNQKSNLRPCNYSQNNMNARKRYGCISKYKGVSWDNKKRKWRVRIGFYRKRIRVGNYKNEIEAAIAYDRQAFNIFGVFAHTNFPLTKGDCDLSPRPPL